MVSAPLLQNNWFGKAVGGMAGLLLSAPEWLPTLVGFAIGMACGALFDRWAQRYLTPIGFRHRLFDNPGHARPSMEFTFAGMGHIARSSGQVLPAHIDYVERLMQRLHFGRADRRRAIDWFTAGKKPGYPFQPLAERCSTQVRRAPELLETLLESLCRITLIADNVPARTALYSLTDLLGLHRAVADQTCAQLDHLMTQPEATLAHAREILGTTPEACEKDIKTAYRRLISRHHPDRLPADATAEQKRLAEYRMTELREALDLLLAAQSNDNTRQQQSASRSG